MVDIKVCVCVRVCACARVRVCSCARVRVLHVCLRLHMRRVSIPSDVQLPLPMDAPAALRQRRTRASELGRSGTAGARRRRLFRSHCGCQSAADAAARALAIPKNYWGVLICHRQRRLRCPTLFVCLFVCFTVFQ